MTAAEKQRAAERGFREALATKAPIVFQRSLTELAVARRRVRQEARS